MALDTLADAILYRSATARGLSQAKIEETTMSHGKFPSGWDAEKVRRVLAHYEEDRG